MSCVAYSGPNPGPVKPAICPVTAIAFIKARCSTLSVAPHPPSLQSSLVCRGPVVNWPAWTVHAFIYVRQVGFVKCHEWRIACNRQTLACPRIIAAAISFEVALQVASVARSVFMTSQLYRRLSALSVLSRYCWVNACRLPSVIRYDTILMLFRLTSPLGDRASPPHVRLSFSDLSPLMQSRLYTRA